MVYLQALHDAVTLLERALWWSAWWTITGLSTVALYLIIGDQLYSGVYDAAMPPTPTWEIAAIGSYNALVIITAYILSSTIMICTMRCCRIHEGNMEKVMMLPVQVASAWMNTLSFLVGVIFIFTVSPWIWVLCYAIAVVLVSIVWMSWLLIMQHAEQYL